jgi:hypothetical protein
MEEFGFGAVQLELKYCERCGGLWLRPTGSAVVFCSPCAKAMDGLFRSPRRVYPSGGDSGSTTAEQFGAFWVEGGNA